MATKQAEKKRKLEDKYPIEAEAHSYRRPKRPTPKSIQRKNGAVVLLTWMPKKFGEGWDDIADRDFEPLQADVKHKVGDKMLTETRIFFQVQDEWAKEDVATHKDAGDEELRFASILINDTKAEELKFDSVSMRGGTAKWRSEVRAMLEANPAIIFSKSIRERIAEQGGVNEDAAPKKATARKRVKKADTSKATAKPQVRRRVKNAPRKG